MEIDEVAARLRDAGCVFAEDEARVLVDAAADAAQLGVLVEKRCRGVPLELCVGRAEFLGHWIAVDEGVFVPRRRSEFLASIAADTLDDRGVLVDLCTGTGAIAVVAASKRLGAVVHACDVDERAVRCARRNLEPYGVHVHHGDLFGALPAALRGRTDVVVANAPYVPSGELGLLPAEAREYEPAVALDGGSDGLDVHRRIAAEVPGWLRPGGVVLTEVSDRQVDTAVAIFARAGCRTQVYRCAELDATVLWASCGSRSVK